MKNRRFRIALHEDLRLSRHFVFAGILLYAVALLAQEQQLKPPDPLPDVPYPPGMDSKEVGQQSPLPNSEVVMKTTPYGPLEYDILRWQSFLQQARQIRSDPPNPAEAARMDQIIPGAEAHLAALLAQQKLQQDLKDAKDCGLGQVIADWNNLKQFVDQERERMGEASAMAQIVEAQNAGIMNRFGGAAAGSMNAASASIMKRKMEMDADASDLAGSNLYTITHNCLEKQAQQKEETEYKDGQKEFDDFKNKVAAASPVAHQKAAEARELAKKGQYKDEGKIRDLITTVFIIARANQLLGNEEGLKQQKEAQDAAILLCQELRGVLHGPTRSAGRSFSPGPDDGTSLRGCRSFQMLLPFVRVDRSDR